MLEGWQIADGSRLGRRALPNRWRSCALVGALGILATACIDTSRGSLATRPMTATTKPGATARPTTATAKPPPSSNCDPNYSGCLKPNSPDYDCAGGGGNGPDYTGPVEVLGDDHHGLDSDDDGHACEGS